jgi:hypothetical protein
MTTTTRNKSRTIKIKMKVKGWTTKVTKTFEFFLKIFKIGTTILWIGPNLSERSLTPDSFLETNFEGPPGSVLLFSMH